MEIKISKCNLFINFDTSPNKFIYFSFKNIFFPFQAKTTHFKQKQIPINILVLNLKLLSSFVYLVIYNVDKTI